MTRILTCDVCVIGAGSGGLSVAAGAAQLGARTILFERGMMGGDCLNYGCVPSKALLAAAYAARQVHDAGRFGVTCVDDKIDFWAAMTHVRNVISAIAPHDSVERFESLGVRVIKSEARFTGPREIQGGDVRVRAKRIVIAAGSTAIIPAIPGINAIPFLTNETIFNLDVRPEHLLILGGGPIGVEMAQAFRRLGSRVTVLESKRLLQRDEPEFVQILRDRLRDEGIEILEGITIARVSQSGSGISVLLDGQTDGIVGSHLLIATGRQPRLESLDLSNGGIVYTDRGIKVDATLRTSNKRVYALGDIIGRPQFTHAASYQAGIVLRNALFRMGTKTDYRALPWVTYSDPELAHVGLTHAEAQARLGEEGVRVTTENFASNDRAQAEAEISGGIKVVMDRKGIILGATILGVHAGELIHLWALAISQNLKLRAVAGLILPYPTLGEISKSAASRYYAPRLFSTWPRRLVRLLMWLS